MRQAGRYMSVYRELRTRYSLLDLCRIPDLATEVTMQPVDASRWTPPSSSPISCCRSSQWGSGSTSSRAKGPQIENPIDDDADIDRLRPFESREALGHVLQAIRQIQVDLKGRIPLIGFAGAPFTLASYAIEGGHSNNFAKTKALMYGHPDVVAQALCAVRRASVTIWWRRSKLASTASRCSIRGLAR
ncbi:MAG: uroporphyrinogen decarboxylase family protein [Vicinamibacterales bacterium]